MTLTDTTPTMSSCPNPSAAPPIWRKPNGQPVSCHEKIRVLNDNYAELRTALQDALDDALLMGCAEAQVRQAFQQLLDGLHASVAENPDAV